MIFYFTRALPQHLTQSHLKPLPMMDMLLSYVSRQKEYTVSKESMVKYKGKKYSVPTKYIGSKLHIVETSDDNICIYYNEDFIACHPITDNVLNYKVGHMHEILKSDACIHLTDEEINIFIEENISKMDLFLGE